MALGIIAALTPDTWDIELTAEIEKNWNIRMTIKT